MYKRKDRFCEDCGVSINRRGSKATRCALHAEGRRLEMLAKREAKPENKRYRAKYRAEPENRQKMAEYRAKYRADPENKQKMAKRTAKWYAKPENKQKVAERHAKYRADPENKLKMAKYLAAHREEILVKQRRRYWEAIEAMEGFASDLATQLG
jgi:hypothetical protein